MRRPWPLLVLFGVCLTGVLAAMAWVTVVAVDLDRREAVLAIEAEREENIRLALWRMESILIPLIAQENARSPLEFNALYTPADVIANRSSPGKINASNAQSVLIPSPLLMREAEHIKLYFQVESNGEVVWGGQVTSPQAPTGEALAVVHRLYGEIDSIVKARQSLEQLKLWGDAAFFFASAPMPTTTLKLTDGQWTTPGKLNVLDIDNQLPQYQAFENVQQQAASQEGAIKMAGRLGNTTSQQSIRNNAEFSQRLRMRDNAVILNNSNSYLEQGVMNSVRGQAPAAIDLELDSLTSNLGEFTAIWGQGELILLRRVLDGAAGRVQGVWLDWPVLKKWLVGEVRDLLPEATVAPAQAGELDDGAGGYRVLAAAPIRLIPGEIPSSPVTLSAPIRNTLALAWVCALLGSVAVAVLLWGIVGLSERRSDFVSSVTHELRTPLTTLQMYTELLASGMVKDEAKRAAYLDTLQHESMRLGRLIENVMAYARLERGRPANHLERLQVVQIIDRLNDRVTALTERHGMQWAVRIDANVEKSVLHTNGAAVDQILSNLVDNACKYAQQADDKRVELVVDAVGGVGGVGGDVRFRVMDHGPGLSADAKRRLFKPFSKSSEGEASSAPGIGLGLALCRRLARQLGGKLTLDPNDRDGCCFVFTLPSSGRMDI